MCVQELESKCEQAIGEGERAGWLMAATVICVTVEGAGRD